MLPTTNPNLRGNSKTPKMRKNKIKKCFDKIK